MDDDFMMQQQVEEQLLRDQRLTDESARWIADPVHRDMMWDDWKKPAADGHGRRTSLIVFLIFVLLTAGAILAFVHAQQPTSSELYQQELIRQLHTDSLGNLSESYKAYERMNQEMDHVVQKEQEHRTAWLISLAMCAVSPLWFMGYVVVLYLRNKTYRPGRREVLLVAVVTIAAAIVMYVINVSFTYVRFFADRSIRDLSIVLVGLLAIGWLVWQVRKGRKDEG